MFSPYLAPTILSIAPSPRLTPPNPPARSSHSTKETHQARKEEVRPHPREEKVQQYYHPPRDCPSLPTPSISSILPPPISPTYCTKGIR